jgi:hypothetical protein
MVIAPQSLFHYITYNIFQLVNFDQKISDLELLKFNKLNKGPCVGKEGLISASGGTCDVGHVDVDALGWNLGVQ